MNNPFENCILVMRTGIHQYILDNQNRESATASCFQFRSWLRQGYDEALARKKLGLADNLVYTLDFLGQNYQREMSRLAQLPGDQAGRLAYMEMIKGFARVKDCIEAGILAEKKMNEGLTGAGMLAAALLQCQKHVETHWAQAKENIWSSPLLHGVMFDHNDVIKPKVMQRFDTDLENNRNQFTKILARPEMTHINLNPPEPDAPPAYDNPQETSVVEFTVGNNVVSLREKPRK